MNYVDYRFGLDVQEIGSQVYITTKQGDDSKRLSINLTEGHEPYEIAEGCVAVFAANKADGNVIFNNATIEGNNIVYDFTEQTVAAVGSMRCEIRLYKDGKLLCSPNFTIAVLPKAVGDAVIESLTEVNTLTGLINEAAALIREVNANLEEGVFVPELEIGLVETLPTGANATASITGTGKNPILNLGLPRGPIGTADGLVIDPELSVESINPVQNKVIAEEFEKVRNEHTEYAQGVADSFAIVGENLEGKVDKVANKGLSTNDFTNAEKEKLAGIEAGANKFVLEDGSVSQTYTATLLATGWGVSNGYYYQDLTISGLSTSMKTTFLDADTSAITAANVIYQAAEIDEAFGLVFKGYVRQENNYRVWAKDIPEVDIPIKITAVIK